MVSKMSNALKILVISLCLMFSVALALGITGAAYNASRKADGTFTMAGGIVIDYTGFGKAEDGEWEKETTTTFKLFTDRAILPGDTINLNAASIKKGASSIDFYSRIRIDYKFYNSSNEDITESIADYSAFMTTPEFNSAWVDGNAGDGWFYYATDTTLNSLPASYVDIFAGTPAINIALNAEGFNHQGGGYKYSSSITITKVEAVLTLEAIQIAGSTWEIIPPALVQNESSQVIQINSNEITLGDVGGAYKLGTGEAGSLDYDATTLGNTLKIIVAGDSQINANAFANSDLEEVYIGDADYINGLSTLSAKIYTTPATFTIGANAFAGCTNLTIYLSSSCNYTIYTNAIPSGATVYYNGSTISLPTSAGAVSGTSITMQAPSIVTGGGSGGSGAGSVVVSPDSYGDYLYTDASGLKWYFNFIDNGASAELKKCKTSTDEDPTGSLSIPSLVSSELVGISVTSIGDHAFYLCTGLTSFTIPHSVTSIGMQAFGGCSSLTSITIPSSVTSIGTYAFDSCNSLTSVTIPNSVTSIGACAFSSCSILGTVTFESGSRLTNIGDAAFCDCVSLTSFSGGNAKYQVLDDGKCLIEVNGSNQKLIAFAPSGVSTYTIPSSVTRIGRDVFRKCTSLTSITIPSSVTSIEDNAFSIFTSLTSITIPSSVTNIGNWAFYECSGLASVTFEGEGRTQNLTIGGSAFSGCSNLATVNFDNWPSSGITVEIGDYAFANTGLGSFGLPNGSTYVVQQGE
ncbi:MAG: leucine-rich repeat domain-containing protein [Clostridia bacterium]|nr:leucine-rich repeat domain-containing protein [Clostridia bacterium]